MRTSPRPSLLGLALLLTLIAVSGGRRTVAQAGTPLDNALNRAQAAQRSAHFAEAATAYASATKLSPRIAELWANRGLMEHLSSQPEMAIASFHQALALKPGLFTPILFTGVDLVATGKPEQALPFLRKALAAQPQNPDATIALARAYTALHQPRPAAEAFQAATSLQPDNASAWYGLAVASLNIIEQDGGTLASHHGGSVWARMLYADELLAQSRLKEGVRLYQETSRDMQPDERAKFLGVLDLAAQTDPGRPAPSSALSPQTLAILRQSLEPASSSALCDPSKTSPLTAACAFLSGNYARGADLASTALSKDPFDVEALFWSVKANEHRAILAFDRFGSLVPQSPATFDLNGDLYRRRSLFAEARAEYGKALAADPHDPAALLGVAAAHLAEAHNEDAIATAKTGLADRPGDPRLNLIIAEALIAQHHFDEARPFLDLSLRHEASADARVHALLGQVAADAGDTKTAIAELRQGLSADRDGSLHFQLFRLLRKSGDLAGAQQAEAAARALQAQRLQNAAIAVDDSQPPQN